MVQWNQERQPQNWKLPSSFCCFSVTFSTGTHLVRFPVTIRQPPIPRLFDPGSGELFALTLMPMWLAITSWGKRSQEGRSILFFTLYAPVVILAPLPPRPTEWCPPNVVTLPLHWVYSETYRSPLKYTPGFCPQTKSDILRCLEGLLIARQAIAASSSSLKATRQGEEVGREQGWCHLCTDGNSSEVTSQKLLIKF